MQQRDAHQDRDAGGRLKLGGGGALMEEEQRCVNMQTQLQQRKEEDKYDQKLSKPPTPTSNHQPPTTNHQPPTSNHQPPPLYS